MIFLHEESMLEVSLQQLVQGLLELLVILLQRSIFLIPLLRLCHLLHLFLRIQNVNCQI